MIVDNEEAGGIVLSHRYSDKRKKPFYERGAGTFELPDLLRAEVKVPLAASAAN
jgi:hypothetical protein